MDRRHEKLAEMTKKPGAHRLPLPGWSSEEDFKAVLDCQLLDADWEEWVLPDWGNFSFIRRERPQPRFLVELERPLIDFNPQLPSTTLTIDHEFREYATSTSVRLHCNWESLRWAPLPPSERGIPLSPGWLF
jgi:hypothetical protein